MVGISSGGRGWKGGGIDEWEIGWVGLMDNVGEEWVFLYYGRRWDEGYLFGWIWCMGEGWKLGWGSVRGGI